MMINIFVYGSIFVLYSLYKIYFEPALFNLKKKRLAKIINISFIVVIIPIAFSLLEPILYRDRIQKDEEFKKKLLSAVQEKELGNEKLKQRLIELRKQIYQSSNEDAEKWAVNFFSIVDIRRDRIEQQKQEERIKKQEELSKLPILFDYILHDFDLKITALKEISPKMQFKKIDSFDLLVNHNNKSLSIREVTFENGNSLKLFLNQGTRDESSIQGYPSIGFSESTKNLNRQKISFRIRKHPIGITARLGKGPFIKDIYYSLEGDNFISDGFKKSISDAFKKALETVFMGDY